MRFIGFLGAQNARYRLYAPTEDRGRKFFKRYDLFPYHSVFNLNIDLPTQKKIRIMYGHSKDSYNFGAWSRAYDLGFTYGPYSQKRMSIFTNGIEVGNSRFDDWFNGALGTTRIMNLKKDLALDPSKKTVLYLPTHGDLSSLDTCIKEIVRLSDTYNVMIRPHFLTHYAEQDKLKKIIQSDGVRSKKIFWLDDFSDLTELLSVSDLVISDNSGAIFDAVLADKPTVLIDILPASYFEKDMWTRVQRSSFYWTFPQTYPDSIEQKVKNIPELRPGEVVSRADMLAAAVTATFARDEHYKKNRAKLRDMLFVHCDGTSGTRAADAIRELMHGKKRQLDFMDYAVQESCILEYGALEHENTVLRSIINEYCDTSHLKSATENPLERILFSVVIPTYNGVSGIRHTLLSLAQQEKIPARFFEIIVIDDGSQQSYDAVVDEVAREYPELQIILARLSKNRGPAVARNTGILLSRGTFISFTDDDCILPQNWLYLFKNAFDENPEIAGVGGWYEPIHGTAKKTSIFGRFVFWLHMPDILYVHKSPYFHSNKSGNTGNMCYRKSALIKAGGFNHYFRLPSLEDHELKMRMREQKFVLMYIPSIIQHTKTYSFEEFIHYCLARGWASMLVYRLFPMWGVYHFTAYSMLTLSLHEVPQIVKKKHIQSQYSERLPFSYWFIPIQFLKNFLFWIGKYTLALRVFRETRARPTQ